MPTIFSGVKVAPESRIHPIRITFEGRDPSLQLVPELDSLCVPLRLCEAKQPRNQCVVSTMKLYSSTCQASLAAISSFSPMGPTLVRFPSSPWMNSRYATGYT